MSAQTSLTYGDLSVGDTFLALGRTKKIVSIASSGANRRTKRYRLLLEDGRIQEITAYPEELAGQNPTERRSS